jgi:DNA-binding protein HU-beta
VHLPVDLAFPALQPEPPSGWTPEFAIDRVKREGRLLIASSARTSILESLVTLPRHRAIEPPFDSLGTFEMNSNDLVAKIAATHNLTKSQAQAILDDVLKNIVSVAATGEEVSLPGFGKFKIKDSPEREGRNPANGEKIKIAASKKLTFSPAKAVRDSLNV